MERGESNEHIETSKALIKLNLDKISRISTGPMQPKTMMQTWVLRSFEIFTKML